MDVLGGGYTLTFSELGEKEQILNTSGSIKITISLEAPLIPFFVENSKFANQLETGMKN